MHKVALVTHSSGGGVWAVTTFLLSAMQRSGRYAPRLFLLATSADDPQSVRIAAPGSWLRKPAVATGQQGGYTCQRVGAQFSELEFQRYKPRTILTNLLNAFDLVLVVAGSPAWGWTTARLEVPVCMFAATRVVQERQSVLPSLGLGRRLWTNAMTRTSSRIEERALRRATAVFAESHYSYRLFQEYVPAQSLILAPPGVDTEFFAPSRRDSEQPSILCVGRLSDPRKNIRLLIEAYYEVVRTLGKAPRLVLAGHSGLSERDWRLASSLDLLKTIELHRDASPELLRSLYQSASLFVLPSNEEGLGVVLLEAMACGIPVVSTDCGGPPTAVVNGENGFLVPTGDPRALARAVVELLVDREERQRMGAAARRIVESRFSIQTAGKTYLDTFDLIMVKRRERA